MEKQKKPSNSNISVQNPYVGFLLGILIVLFLNGLLFPNIGNNRILSTDYVSFIEKVDGGKVKNVVIKSGKAMRL